MCIIFCINQVTLLLDSVSNQIDQAKVEKFRLLNFRLGYCGSDEEVKALDLITIGVSITLSGGVYSIYLLFF